MTADQGGRIVKRWVAECDYTDDKGACGFNERKDPRLHASSAAAMREARDHAAADHVGARQVDVRRTYKLEREEIVG